MSYLVRADVESKVPPTFITEALDDDNDGLEDPGLWDKLDAAITADIDGPISQRYPLPLEDPPAFLRSGACFLACETLFQRRGTAADANPFTAAAAKFRTKLEAIAAGTALLTIAVAPTKPPISIITEPSGTVPRQKLNG